MTLEAPETFKQSGRYGVRFKASAPSIHMVLANIESEISPIVGTEKQSEDMMIYLQDEFTKSPTEIWSSNLFGKSLHDLVSEDLNAKLMRLPDDIRCKLQETLQRIINEGCQGVVCIIV